MLSLFYQALPQERREIFDHSFRRRRRSMRHQYRYRHVLQQRAGRAAEQQLAETRVAVGAHYEEIGAKVGGPRQQHIAD